MKNDDLDLEFDFDSDDPFEENEIEAPVEAAPAEKKDAVPTEDAVLEEDDEFTEEDAFAEALAPVKPAKPPGKPRPSLPMKTKLGIIGGVAVVAVAVAVTLLLVLGLTPQERRAAVHVETLLAEARAPESFVLLGDIVTIQIEDERLGDRPTYVFVTRREIGRFGFVQRMTAIFWDGVFIGNAEDTVARASDEATEQDLMNELHRRRAQRHLESWEFRVAQAEEEGRSFEPSSDWHSFSTASGERIARSFGIAWEEE